MHINSSTPRRGTSVSVSVSPDNSVDKQKAPELRESVTSRFVNGDVILNQSGYTLKRAFSRSSSKMGGGLG